jgi:hypothetical protein
MCKELSESEEAFDFLDDPVLQSGINRIRGRAERYENFASIGDKRVVIRLPVVRDLEKVRRAV